ncbi:class D sortase [Alkalicoccus chagannorensis]|uniref:class D sortase n=1 Tax=Alkalicoccus chagannorensis TaxID=427072 RepID=UPI0003FDF161|nr:class D sortase [Alkalicoccus chagannorensis]
MKTFSNVLILAGVVMLAVFGFTIYQQSNTQNHSLEEAESMLEEQAEAEEAGRSGLESNTTSEQEESSPPSPPSMDATFSISSLFSGLTVPESVAASEHDDVSEEKKLKEKKLDKEIEQDQRTEPTYDSTGVERFHHYENQDEILEEVFHNWREDYDDWSTEEQENASSDQASPSPSNDDLNVQEEDGGFTMELEENDPYAVLNIPKLDADLPVLYGADEDTLDRGVGHMPETAFPGEGEQIAYAGHRDTVFRDFGEMEIGDRMSIATPYGEYEYEIREFDIVDADDRSVIRDMDEEVLVLITCYPFEYWASAPERFIVYAYPVEE